MIRSVLIMIALAMPITGVAAPVLAQQVSEQLIRSVERELPNYVQGVDVRALTVGQVSSLHTVLYSDRSQSDIRAQVNSILGGLDMFLFGRNLSAL